MSAEEDTLYKGRRFDTYEELEMCVKSYETINKQKFYKIRSRTITSASNSLKRKLKQSLVYYEIEYACIHGKRRAKRGNGIKKTSTLRQGCEANFKLRVSSEGHSLQICSINTMHTKHELSQKVYDHLPQTRALNEDELKSVQTFLSLDANKKKIQSKVLADTGKKTTLKDLQNINYRRKIEKNDLDEVVSLLTKSYGCMVDIFCDEDEKFKAMQFTTQDMRNALNAWPEFISIDGTYKLIDIGCTVFLCLVVDSNGQSEIANVSLISTEDKKTYHWIFEQFKKHFDFTKVKSFMGDKDLVERQVVKDLFPNTPFYLCIFHTLKTFRREVTCDKMNISREERDLSLNYLQKLVYSKNESEYDLLYSQFKECVPQSVIAYFEKNWHRIRNEWTIFNMKQCNFNNTTNNRMESINQKIKQVVHKNSTLMQFVKNFFIFINSNQQERDFKAATHILKKPLFAISKYSKDILCYSNVVTRYSMKFIQEQINFIDNVKVGIEGPTGTFTIASSKGNLSVTHEYCPCSDFLSMMLPCRHIFAVRVKQNMPLYSESLVHERWKTSFYLTKQRIANQESIQVGDHHVYRSEPKMKTLTITEKRKSATLVANSLVNTLSMASGSEFNHKLNFLKRIDDAWKSGKEINIDIPNSDSQIGKTLIDEEENEKLVMSVDTEVNSQGDESARESHLPNITIEPQTTYEERKVTLENEKENLSENINIELPLKIKKRGRPRGHDTTVIGLKKKRNKIVPLKFALKISESQDCYILRHVINDDIEVTEETLLNPSFEVMVEDLKNEIPDCVLDDSVNLARLKRYFVTDAWEYFSFMLNDKKSKEDWTCRSCAMQLGNRPSIVCESCLFWFHLECSALTKLPRIKTWFCIYCYNKL